MEFYGIELQNNTKWCRSDDLIQARHAQLHDKNRYKSRSLILDSPFQLKNYEKIGKIKQT
jgi:hypothetical protein